jgi:hypothetical protein
MNESLEDSMVQASDEGLGHFMTFTQERGNAMIKIIHTWLEINMKYEPHLAQEPVHVPDIGNFSANEIIGMQIKNRS